MILKIEKMVFEGTALAHDENGMVVFVKGALDGDTVRVHITKKNKNYITANAVEIIEKSPHRIKPICPYNKPCGGCDFGFIDYDYQLKIKENIVKEIFNGFDVDILPIQKSPKNLHYRAKTQYPTSETRDSKRPLIGYYKENTHEIVNIKYCPIQPEIIDKIVQYFRENWVFTCYSEKTSSGLLRHINTRISNSNGEILLTLVLNSDKLPDISEFINGLTSHFPQIKGVFANFNNKKTNKITGEKTVLLKGENSIVETLGDVKYKIGANSFFQVNPKCAELLFGGAKKLIKNKGTLLDLYGGVGTIGIFLKDVATKIYLIEENSEAISLAKENYKLNNVIKYEVFEGCAQDKIKHFIKKGMRFENILIDPPRKGSDYDTLIAVSKMTNSVIYISCNPMTLKRDAEILIKEGFKFISTEPFDMFPNTHHIELLAYFKRG